MALLAGDKLGPYEILAPIGAGGMGEVYRARDPRLGRIVAIKVSKERFSGRFEREARAVAALNHPHICQLYDVGPNFLVMEFVEGEPLKGPVPPENAIRLALEVAGALEEAHAQGILHRDLKPANILVSQKGSVKLLDFGVAKLLADPSSDVTQTLEGTVMGSPAYMSPEQAQGMPVDVRSEVFSFGAVLYEMLAGTRAFAANSTAGVFSAILRDEPAPLSAPEALRQIVARCLAKAPENRFASIAEVREALEGARDSRPQRDTPSVAVLPFTNLSPDPDNEYFSDGLTEEIISALTHLPGLHVTARTSSFAFRGKEQDVSKIAEALHVRTLLEGSVRRSGNRIRVSAQLINATDGYHLWSERYDRDLTDVFAVQDEIAAAIAAALEVKLSPKPAGAARHAPNLQAYEAFLRGRHQLFRWGNAGARRTAKEHFEQACVLDPQYAAPHVALGNYYFLEACGKGPGTEALPLARAEARKALELSPSETSARALLGMVAGAYDYDWKEAEREFGRALEGDNCEVRWGYAHFHLHPLGRFEEAVVQLEKALEQDPLRAEWHAMLACSLYCAGRHDDALAEVDKALEIDASHWLAKVYVVEINLARRMYPEALAAAERLYQFAPKDTFVFGMLAGLLERNASKSGGERLEQPPRFSESIAAVFYEIIRGKIDRAAEAFERRVADRHPLLLVYAQSPLFAPLRESAHWPRLAKLMNLP
jgi:serine/threonine-protein kinase